MILTNHSPLTRLTKRAKFITGATSGKGVIWPMVTMVTEFRNRLLRMSCKAFLRKSVIIFSRSGYRQLNLEMPLLQIDYAMLGITNQPCIMCRKEDCRSSAMECCKEFENIFRCICVETSGRFIGQNYFGFADNSPGNGNFLLLSTR